MSRHSGYRNDWPAHCYCAGGVDPTQNVLKNGVICNTHTYVRYFKSQAHSWKVSSYTGNYYGIIPHKRSVALCSASCERVKGISKDNFGTG